VAQWHNNYLAPKRSQGQTSNLLESCWKFYCLRFSNPWMPWWKPYRFRLHLLVMMKVLLSLVQTHWWPPEKPYHFMFKPVGGDRPSESPYCFRFKFVGDSVKVLLCLLSFGLTWSTATSFSEWKQKPCHVLSHWAYLGVLPTTCQLSLQYSCIPEK
jgi:hypothetical protein